MPSSMDEYDGGWQALGGLSKEDCHASSEARCCSEIVNMRSSTRALKRIAWRHHHLYEYRLQHGMKSMSVIDCLFGI
jgi:hypothetical protein